PPSRPPPPEPPSTHSEPPEPESDESSDQHSAPDTQESSNLQEAPETPEDVLPPTPGSAPVRLAALPAPGRHPGGAAQGRVVRAAPDSQTSRLALPDTLRAALLRSGGKPFELSRADFHTPVHEKRGGRRVLFVADTSGSMGAQGRMGAVKGAMLAVLEQQARRDRVALITFRATGAVRALEWTADATLAEAAITAAPTGGRTPLAHALVLAREVLATEPGAELVLFTDGRANVALSPSGDAWADALEAARALGGVPALVVDTEAGHVRLGRAGALAEVLGARVQPLWPTPVGAP
ncbi:VWA domain-containing protein, partial [Deinococcus deserti]